MNNAIKSSTKQTYASAQRKYIEFCVRNKLLCCPASVMTLRLFISYLFKSGLKGQSIRVYMSAIRFLHISNDYLYPEHTPQIQAMLRGSINLSPAPNRKQPITFEILAELCNKTKERKDELLLRTVMSVMFYGCLRLGEISLKEGEIYDPSVHIRYKDAKIQNDTLSLLLKSSKTDKIGQGTVIYIGCSNNPICALCYMKEYLKEHPNPHSKSPLFMSKSAVALTRNYFISILRILLVQIGLEPSLYGGHSFRAGSATSAADAGFNQWELKMLGRWASNVYSIYLRNPKIVATFAPRLAKS